MHELRNDTFARIADLMHATIGLALPDSKRALVASRLAPRIQRLELDGFDAYYRLIAAPGAAEEFQVAVDLLTTNETYFFREKAHYELLEQELRRARPRSLRIWSAASSFGDEAYSTAMLLADLEQQGVLGSDWSILGTDISDRVLRSAIEAVYPAERLRDVSPDRLRRHCLRGEGGSDGLVQIHPKVRRHVKFGQLNLCQPIDVPGPFDAIFLRNVLIYFDLPTKTDVVDRVLERLRPEGLFFLGTAEGRVPCKTPLKTLAPGVFRKIAS